MAVKVTKIVVAGDVTIDWLQWKTKPNDSFKPSAPAPSNWRIYPGLNMVAREGGALLLAKMVSEAVNTNGLGVKVLTHQLNIIESIPPTQVIHSNCILDTCAKSGKDDEKQFVYRVAQHGYYSGPDPLKGNVPPQVIVDDDPTAELVILDDAGNGFRDSSVWPKALSSRRNPIIVYKMSRPLAEGELWEKVTTDHADNLVVVLNADDLREWGGNISRRLSWERTAQDFVWQIAHNDTLHPLANCKNVVVRFGLDAAIHYERSNNTIKSTLYYDPKQTEDGFAESIQGMMQGLTGAFVAALSARLAHGGMAAISNGIKKGIISSRRMLQEGFGKSSSEPDYPIADLFTKLDSSKIASIVIPMPTPGKNWTILENLAQTRLEQVAMDYVRKGSNGDLDNVPMAKIGKLQTIDRTEIESYQSIRNVMREYIKNPNPKRPLSIAVFGPPGSGKSFGVTEIAENIAPGEIERIEFNVSQFQSPDDLAKAFHKVRDITLQGKIPLVFFDEFDSHFRTRLGWLKYFLAPMQDGKFKDGESVHIIGKSIFVFAGGTSYTFQGFYSQEDPAQQCLTESEKEKSEFKDGTKREERQQEFRDAKGPDFVSRLRGYINIMGPNQCDDDDMFFIIRRALLLRYNLWDYAKGIFDSDKTLRIDDGVLRALLKVPRYKHGVRSMLAILDMSMLSGRRKFEQSALPSKEQLDLHVDAEIFAKLVMQDVLLGDAQEKLAKLIHENYIKERQKKEKAEEDKKKHEEDPSMKPWDQLEEFLKQSNLRQADHYPVKLEAIKCGIAPANNEAKIDIVFTKEEIEIMAKKEHDRWMQEKLDDGYSYGVEKDSVLKTHRCLLPWEDLPEEEKDKDRTAVKNIPEVLTSIGFEVYRMA